MTGSSDAHTITHYPDNTEHNRKQENQSRLTGGNNNGGFPQTSCRNGGCGVARKASNHHPRLGGNSGDGEQLYQTYRWIRKHWLQ